jgi:hypothetical protein
MNDRSSPYPPGPFDQVVSNFWQNGLRIVRNVAIAGVLAGLCGMVLGAVLTDGWLAQIFVTLFASFLLWLPMIGVTLWASRLAGRRRRPDRQQVDVTPNTSSTETAEDRLAASWRRLGRAAPRQRERITALERSLGRSRTSLGQVRLDSDAHELCAMIDRRLPDLIDHELDSLAPDSRGRDQQVSELVDLVEQFVRHCGTRSEGAADQSAYQAEILKRRFETRLSNDQPFLR